MKKIYTMVVFLLVLLSSVDVWPGCDPADERNISEFNFATIFAVLSFLWDGDKQAAIEYQSQFLLEPSALIIRCIVGKIGDCKRIGQAPYQEAVPPMILEKWAGFFERVIVDDTHDFDEFRRDVAEVFRITL